MLSYDINDTIAAVATPLGASGIGIVRIGGKDALKISDKIFVSKDGKRPSDFRTYTTHYGWIVKPLSNCRVSELPSLNSQTEIVDEVILTVMRAPKSYTKEDIVEINCHGGIVALRRVLDLALENDARLAEPGEFTKRAFLNGRIDLAQAEAVLDIINAKTEYALKIGVSQLSGFLSRQVVKLRNELFDILSDLEANINFPEEDIGTLDLVRIADNLNSINDNLMSLSGNCRFGRLLHEGLKVVICGKPNVGKSSLLNALLKQERSIVTPIAGTTRDTIEEIIDIKGIPIRIMDTAGILEPRDLIEKKAIRRSNKLINSADLVLLLFDGNRKLDKNDALLIKKLVKKNMIAIINKLDLKQHIEKAKLTKQFMNVINISAKKTQNINLLEDAIVNIAYGQRFNQDESLLVTNLRHAEALKTCQKLIAASINSLDNKLSFEFISQDIKDALGFLDGILGNKFTDDLLDNIFSKFCVGK